MSLNKTLLEAQILAVFVAEQTATTDPLGSCKRIAKGIADAVDLFIKSGTVNATVQTTVTTVGTATAQTGTGVGTAIGTIT